MLYILKKKMFRIFLPMDFDFLTNFKEVAIMFSSKFNHVAVDLYDKLRIEHPHLNIFLVSCPDVICSAKFDSYESYIIVGIECPLHSFRNSVQYKLQLEDSNNLVGNFEGSIFVDSLYSLNSNKLNSNMAQSSDKILIVSENQQIIDYYNTIYEEIMHFFPTTVSRTRVEYLMKENIMGAKMEDKKMIGVIFTSQVFENIADILVKKINTISRAYKIFLKDISYERLISIDNLDCIVLVDCPVFICDTKVHIPIISPFSVECFLNDQWSDDYKKNTCSDIDSKDIVISSLASQIMIKRDYQGVLYSADENDMNIHEGQKGIAATYENEGI